MALDFSGHQKFFHNKETITYYDAQLSPQLPTASTITDALRNGTDRVEGAPSGGVYTLFQTGWHLKPTLNFIPKPGDYIKDSLNRYYNVISVQKPIFNTFWGLNSIGLDIEPELDNEITLYDCTFTTDAYAARVSNFSIGSFVYQNMPCRIQPKLGSVSYFLGHKGLDYSYTIWLSKIIPLTYGDVLRDSAGVYYKVVDFGSVGDITSLMWVTAVINPMG